MLQYKFVEFIPDNIAEGVLYISIEYCTAIHKCVCGCGNEVVTPLSPTDWKLTFDGKSVSLHPSIGNWNFECKSHYWITNNRIDFAGRWNEKEIRLGREEDMKRKKDFFEPPKEETNPSTTQEKPIRTGFWEWFMSLFR
ncbi:DUF6527 family protein [Arsenicibacter rosenii]|uniref:Uncharacterized protein n=1 Tax=Arsenicibacter rosenii TaxID=1750698 RepID=A0A1S2VDV9_9BACT|nr:DUF6527 family protein [Arsenicibacter rosenii]OIN56386.1 hypothetical protein BLX24_24730 [Arsenicibacter rosenii]